MFGNHITAELEKVTGKDEKQVARKRQNKLLQLLDAPAEQRFRKVTRPPSGEKLAKRK